MSGTTETAVGFQSAVRVSRVAVEAGQRVDEAQILVEADTATIETDLLAAQARTEQAKAGVDSARGALETRLRRATADLEQLVAPPSDSDRLAAEAAVSAARTALRRAEADPAELNQGQAEVDILAADQAVAAAQLAVKKTESDLQRLRQGPDPAQLRRAESDLSTAEAAYQRALDSYRLLIRGPDPFEVRAAERAVDNAEESLRVARQVRPLPASQPNTSGDGRTDRSARERAQREAENNRIQYEAGVRRAENALEDARDRLARLTQGPARSEVDAAIQAIESAKRQVDDARESQARLRAGAARLDIESGEAAVASAKVALVQAEARRASLNVGVSAGQLAAARAGIETARLNLATAESRLSDLTGPRRLDSPQVRDARALVDTLRRILDAPPEQLDAIAGDVGANDKELGAAVQTYRDALRALGDQDRRRASLEASFASSRLVAPYAGFVTAVLTRAGDSTSPGRPVIRLVQDTDPVVRAELSARDGSRLAVGQEGTVETSDRPGVRVPAVVTDVAGGENERPVVLTPAWDSGAPSFGTSAQIAINVQRKDGVLIVPQRAVRVAGSRRFVDVLEGSAVRRVEVEVGITSGSDVEVTGPLREGQQVSVTP